MTKEIRSAATRDASSVSNDKELQQDYKRGVPPERRSKAEQYEEDLHGDGSLEKTANEINRKQKAP